jgi:hypothetical protein
MERITARQRLRHAPGAAGLRFCPRNGLRFSSVNTAGEANAYYLLGYTVSLEQQLTRERSY